MAISIASHLILNPSGVYYFRIVIPSPLRPILGKRELKKSLKTSNRKRRLFCQSSQFCTVSPEILTK